MKVIYFGTPPFAAEVLTHLLRQGVNIVAVVTKPDKPQGRSSTPVPTPVKIAALAYNPALPVYQPALVSTPEFAPSLEKHQADLFVVVAYGEIMKQHLLEMPKRGCINLHASLLPKYRGAAPIQRCLIEGETETGVSIMHMVKKMDAGDVIKTVRVPIDPDMTFGELEVVLLKKGSAALLETIRAFEKDEVARFPQDHSQATFAPKIELEDCQINWTQSARSIHNLVRGVNPYPGAWCYVEIRGQRKRLKILKTKVVEEMRGYPGEILKADSCLILGCGEGALNLLEVQLEGKRAMHTQELLKGISINVLNFPTE
jgi:methionyl-tRNA formyltransferase